MSEKESILIKNKHILVCIDEQLIQLDSSLSKELEYIKSNFCGIVVSKIDKNYNYEPNTIVYLCGDIEKNYNEINNSELIFKVIEELSFNYFSHIDNKNYGIIHFGYVPINVHNAGVYFRKCFNQSKDYFDLINSEHKFQSLTESNKSDNAFRTGIYLTKVEEANDEIKFNLLRCSSNLHGPTDNFRSTDNEVINLVKYISKHFFEAPCDLNHVLAQIYENKVVENNSKQIERKAKISTHSDKTKDMPKNGLIAFCTFYKNYSNGKFNGKELKHIKKSNDDAYDYCYNDISVLTKLRFKLKETVTDSTLEKQFDVVLYPNSVFIISLVTNRLYTHEIAPSILPIDKIPVRMGYVIRCSKTKAVFKNNQTYINENGNCIKLEKSDNDGVKKLKEFYYKENVTGDTINYDKFYFSLNEGDYKKPIA